MSHLDGDGTLAAKLRTGLGARGGPAAAAAGATYPDLLRRRLAGPLGLGFFYAPAGPDQLRPGALIGRKPSGKPVEPWTGEALAPAGGLWASSPDLAQRGNRRFPHLDGFRPFPADWSRRHVRVIPASGRPWNQVAAGIG